MGIPYSTFLIQFSHGFTRVTPTLIGKWETFPLIHHVRPRIRNRHIIEPVNAASVIVIVAVFSFAVFLGMFIARSIPYEAVTLCVKENCVRNTTPSFAIAVRRCSLPNNFVSVILFSEDAIKDDFQIMARGRVAMEIQAASGF